jgi:seryl-tRNA synthetase
MKHRKYLRVIKSRQAKQTSMDQRTAIDSHVNYRYLSSQEKDDKIKKLHKELTATKRMLNNVKSKLNRAIQEEGHVLDNEISGYLKEILAIGENLKNELPEGTFRRIFWQQKMQALSCKDTRQIR